MQGDDVVYVDTPEGAALFDSADVRGHFWTICRYFVSEKFLTYCGIASSVTVLNSLGVDAPAGIVTPDGRSRGGNGPPVFPRINMRRTFKMRNGRADLERRIDCLRGRSDGPRSNHL